MGRSLNLRIIGTIGDYKYAIFCKIGLLNRVSQLVPQNYNAFSRIKRGLRLPVHLLTNLNGLASSLCCFL